MLRLSPFQRAILNEFEHAEQAYLLPLMLTCGARFPEQPTELIGRITVGAICQLMRGGYLEAFYESTAEQPATPPAPPNARDVLGMVRGGALYFDDVRWRWNPAIGGEVRVGFRLTPWRGGLPGPSSLQ